MTLKISNSKLKIKNWWKYLLITFSITLGLIFRLYKINSPVADWHSFRQADTASVTRNYLKAGISLLKPTYHDLSNIQSGIDNPQGYRMVEFPIYNTISVLLAKVFPTVSLEIISRLINIAFSLCTALLIYAISLKITSEFLPSFFAMVVYLFLPFSIYYSRTILPEPSAIFFMMLTLYLFPRFPIISAIPFALSILIKPYTAIIIFPLLVFFSILNSYFLNLKSIIRLFIFSLISLLPFIFWRHWIQQFPAGIPKNDWLFLFDPSHRQTVWWHGYNISWFYPLISFKPYWWRWIFYERLSLLILGCFGIIPFFLGLAYRKKQAQHITSLSLFGIFLYFSIVAGGNVRHDYYQSLIIPFISIIVGYGFYYILNYVFQSKIIGVFSCLIIFGSTIFISWNQTKDYYKINRPEIVTIGEIADQTLPSNALIIAPFNGDTAFLYQTHRSGWPTEIYDLPFIKKNHPQNPIYLISLNNDLYRHQMEKEGKIIYSSQSAVIIDLNL